MYVTARCIAAIVSIKEITNGHWTLDFPETVKNNETSLILIRFHQRFFVSFCKNSLDAGSYHLVL